MKLEQVLPKDMIKGQRYFIGDDKTSGILEKVIGKRNGVCFLKDGFEDENIDGYNTSQINGKICIGFTSIFSTFYKEAEKTE
jgi:hypothetical protein